MNVWKTLDKNHWTKEGQKQMEDLGNIVKKISNALTKDELNELAIRLDEGKELYLYDLLVAKLIELYPEIEIEFNYDMGDNPKKEIV